MKKYNGKQSFLRSQIAKSMIKQRHLAKQLRDYCRYSISKRKINNILLNTSYLFDLLNDIKKEKEIYSYLVSKLHETYPL